VEFIRFGECNQRDERLKFIARLLDGQKMAVLCGKFGISRKTGYKILKRYRHCGLEGLLCKCPFDQGEERLGRLECRSLAEEPIVRLILDGTAVKVRLDRKATMVSLLVVIGVRADGQKLLLTVKAMGSESAEAWRSVLDDLIKRGLRRPELLIIDGGGGLESALDAVWGDVPVQRCTVHEHRNLLAHAPKRLHEEVTADYNDMICAGTREQVEARRKAFIRKWRLKHRAVADSLEEAGERLFTFTRLPLSQWKSARTTNAIERLHEEFKRRIKTQTVLPSSDTAAMLFWALMASGQITMRKVDGWNTLATKPSDRPFDLAA
jgi:putative transposase